MTLPKPTLYVVTKPLTLASANREIHNAFNAITRHRIEQLGPQFTVWRDSELRDSDREGLFRMMLCSVCLGCRVREVWW